jgi:hypothetical protein
LGALFLMAALAVNAGYIYRVDCPRANGSTEREWTYQLNSVIPYFAYSRSGCETHSATRVALSSVGLWKIGGGGGGGGGSAGNSSEDHTAEYLPGALEPAINACTTTGKSRSFCQCAYGEVARRLTPDEFNRVALALNAGQQAYQGLPESIRERIHEADVVAERDC